MRGQIVHIFRKDVRRHWREIAVAIATLVAFAWIEPKQWMSQEFRPNIQFLAGLIVALVPVGWAFLIVRLVHDESLVGDRQFWVTRPYEWKKLLAAKLLFVLVFVNVPLLMADAVLLMKAGFGPISYMPELLWLQLLWILVFILPAATLGTITRSIGQAVLVILGAILCIVGVGLLGSSASNSGLPRAESIPGSLQLIVLVAACVAVVMWQYARRRTVRSRVLLASAIVAAAFIMPLATPQRRLIARAYPQAGAGKAVPVQLAFDSEKQTQAGSYSEKDKVDIRMIRIPLIVSGMSQGSVIGVDGAALTVAAPGGQQWRSGWRGSGAHLFPNHHHAQTYFAVDKAFFERVKTTPVRLHISFALVEFREKEARRIVARAGEFVVPGEGRCSLAGMGQMVCLFPLRRPFLLVSAQSEEITCAPREKETPLPAGMTGYGWIENRMSSPAEFGISPVRISPLYISDWGELSDHYARPGVCPGTPLSFGILEEVQGVRSELEIDGIRLADYEVMNRWGQARGVGIQVH
jgi:hypothetical protein